MARAPAAITLALALLALGSCGPTVVATAGVSALQAGSAAFINGELEVADRVPMGAAFAASHRALEVLGFPIERESIYKDIAFLTAREGGGRRIKIVLERKSPMVTKFNVRVGLGDQSLSKLLMMQVQDELKTQWGPPAEPVLPGP
jgi:hypothetical protein